MDIEKKMEEIIKDEEFIKRILNAETITNAQEIFREKDIELNEEELKIIGASILKCVEHGSALTSSELDKICGGNDKKPSESSDTSPNTCTATSSKTYSIARGIGKVFSAPFVAIGYTAGAAPYRFCSWSDKWCKGNLVRI